MIGQTLGHYRILEQVGAGGMGIVYRAHDDQLDRDVALKILPPKTVTEEASRRRFRNEALALAKLNHPNIGVIYEFGTQNGVDFLVMEHIPGKTLCERLVAGSLAEKETVALGAQIAAALAEAHEQGVVHRDLTPSNILVTPKGQAKVLDFGLAKLLRQGSEQSATQTSDIQNAAGTLPYMTPEQLRGEDADPRTDIHALGAVLYEMATSQRAFRETLASRLIDSILHHSPVAPRAANPRVSPELERVILKCMEKDPENRYQSAKELAADLRRLGSPGTSPASQTAPRAQVAWKRSGMRLGVAVIALAALIGAGNIGHMRDRLLGRGPVLHIRSLAVLPFENLSGDPQQEYFVDGMTEALINRLAQINALKVISRTSAMQYKGAKKPLPQIGRSLHVDALVEGSVVRSGDRVRISAELVEVSTDKQLLAQSYERDLRDVLGLQSEIAQAIAKEIKIKLTSQEQARLASTAPVSPQAFEACLKGRYFWNKRTGEGFRKGVEYFEQAIEADHNYAPAYAGLADSYLMLSEYGLLTPKEGLPRAKAAAAKALELDDTLAEAHTSLGSIKEDYDWDWVGAQREFQRAIELNQGSAMAHQWYAEFLASMGKFDEAVVEITRAREIDPLSLIVSTVVGEILFESRRYEQAVEQLHKTLEMDANFAEAHRLLGEAYVQLDQPEQAVAEFQRAITLSGDSPQCAASLARFYAVSGKQADAKKMLERLKAQSAQVYVSSADLSLVFVGLGDKDRAFKLLREAYEQRDPFVININVDPRLDSLRSDARFEKLIRGMDLTPIDIRNRPLVKSM
jgi:TolB-like protein/tRNA A-37 threonylcarbamoyl transferase component Bud32/Tfp pilus assembly protein PilF